MRFAVVPFVLLVCSSVNAATATTTDPSVENQRIDMSRPPPPPTNVNVLNFPDVQTVGGTVDLGNLPLDADGAVRVTSAPTRPVNSVELLDAPIHMNGGTTVLLPVSVNVGGASRVGVFAQGSSQTVVNLVGQWSDDEPFVPIADTANGVNSQGFATTCQSHGEERLMCPVTTGAVRVWMFAPNAADITSVRVYLFP